VCFYYESVAAFERFAKVAAIGLLAWTVARECYASHGLAPDGDVAPWLALAQKLGYNELASALAEVDLTGWRASAMKVKRPAGSEVQPLLFSADVSLTLYIYIYIYITMSITWIYLYLYLYLSIDILYVSLFLYRANWIP